MRHKGFFVTFEGAEGSGKSTQIHRTAAYLRSQGRRVLVLREPGGSRVSEAIRGTLLNKKFKEMEPETELLLYLAARAQIVREKILPALRQGKLVICDRFEDSTKAYQGFGRGMPLASIEKVSRMFVRNSLQPALTFLLDFDPREGMKRGGRQDRIEKESLTFHQRVRRGFLALARRNPKRFVVLNGRQSKTEIFAEIKGVLDRVIK